MKKELLLVAGATVAAVLPAAAKKVETPNVIYILVDDLGYGDLSCYGQTKFSTPHIDALANGGMQFMQHYAGSTVSAPSRGSLMTGKHTGNSFIRGNKAVHASDEKKYDTALPAVEVTLAELFKERNYSTACIGKWGMGAPESEGDPNNQGFDYFYGYLGQEYAHNYYPPFLHENGEEVTLGGEHYSHDLIEQKAMNYIKEQADSPFFLYLTFTIPHAELIIPDEYNNFKGEFPETPFVKKAKGTYSSQSQPHAAFAAMVERMDLSVGRIMELLEEQGIDENTLVIFSSDNGAHAEGGADPDFFNSTGEYRGHKRDLYEGGIRVPMIASWKGHIPAGKQSNMISAFWDMMPTFAQIIDVDAPENIDGISILPELRGKRQKQQHDYLYWEFHEGQGKRAVRRGDWKLIELNVRNAKQRKFELYNIATDPSEKNDVAVENRELVDELKQLLFNTRSQSQLFKFPAEQ